jgi:hypothetical protein
MAGGQGAARGRGVAQELSERALATPPQVVVHDLDEARAALAAAAERGEPIQLRSAVGAASYAGVGYLKALGEAVDHELIVDCGDDAGLVMAALRTGCRRLVFSGDEVIARKLVDMADQLGARLDHETGPADRPPVGPAGRAAAAATLRAGNDRSD